MATFMVVNTLDGPGTGPVGSLRWAVAQASASGDSSNRVVITQAATGKGHQSPGEPVRSAVFDLFYGQIDVGANVSIENGSNKPVLISQATPGSRVFNVASGVTDVSIGSRSARASITIAGGKLTTADADGGGILIAGTTNLTLTNVYVQSNSTADGDGGGIYAQGGTITLVGSSMVSNQAPNGNGGGIYVANGSVVLTNRSHVDANFALNVGGIGVDNGPSASANAVQLLNGSTANWNGSTATVDPEAGNYGGGGIAVQGPGSVYVSKSQVSNNHSNGMYSAGILVTLGNVTVTNSSQVNGNSNRGPGGGIAANFLGSVVVTNHSQVNNNTGGSLGGGIVNFATPAQSVTIDRSSQVSGNMLTNAQTVGQTLLIFLQTIAAGAGGSFQTLTGLTPEQAADAIQQLETEVAAAHGVDPPTITGRLVAGGGIATLLGARVQVLNGSRVDRNYAGGTTDGSIPVGVGGGIANILGSVQISNGSVSGNTSTEDGGGVWARREVRITRGTLSQNLARGETLGALGGAMFLGSPTTNSLITNSTIQRNNSEYGGGVYNMGVLTVQNTNVTSNQASQSGGGYGNTGTLTLLGGTVTRNVAAVSGGGVSNQGQFNPMRTKIVGNSPDNVSSS